MKIRTMLGRTSALWMKNAWEEGRARRASALGPADVSRRQRCWDLAREMKPKLSGGQGSA